ncbi:hypothetical protein LOK49_Contig338G00002 [Camellia lanceoleosa]|nr:hypothetical protein LOK49_Contig338G00002 [Camellia lanceoleosa]
MAVVVLVEEKNKRRDLKDFELTKARSEGFKEHLIQIWGFRIRYIVSGFASELLKFLLLNAFRVFPVFTQHVDIRLAVYC